MKNDICRRSASFGPQEALRAYAALLGTDGTMGFALVDLDEDGTPELICGEIDTKGQSEQIALTDYTLYTWKNDQVTELYHGFVDTWINPDVRVTTAGAIVNEGHGTSAGYELQYVRWDGVQIEHHDFWSYAKTEDVSGERVCYLDDVEVSEAVFDERLAACTADDEYVLHFLASTPENCRKYLRDSIQASRQPEQPQLNEQELLALLQENLAWLNAVENELFFVELRGASCMAVVSYENGQYGAIKRLVPEGNSADIEQTLAEDEAIDPAYRSFSPISNYSSKEQILNTLRDYMDVDCLGIMQNAYATVSDVLNDNVWEFNGGLYLVRGGRGYGVYDYDPQTLRIVSSDETACEAECDLLYFEQFYSVQTISFEKRNGRWIIVHVGKAGSSADPYTITAETRADRSLYPRPERTLERGSQGEDVKYVQAMLVVMNYDGVVVDGDFGPATEAALMRWQKNHSLTQTGVVDADTLQQLEAAETEWLLRE
ncbi:MAG: peptidoglycan-binding domain-containing protein [Oscillospiraceae bacterium]